MSLQRLPINTEYISLAINENKTCLSVFNLVLCAEQNTQNSLLHAGNNLRRPHFTVTF